MAENLTWFKFNPFRWFMGRISRQQPSVQADFLRLCCIYWSKECNMSLEDAETEIPDSIDLLIKTKIIKSVDGHIFIDFLDEQIGEIEGKSKIRSQSARKRWEKAKMNEDADELQKDANAMQMHKDELQNDADKIRQEQIREDEKRNDDVFVLEAQKENFKKNKYTDEFESFWIAYDKKGSKSKAFSEWKKLDPDDKAAAVSFIPLYFASKPDKQYRKDAERYLSSKAFEDSIPVIATPQTSYIAPQGKSTRPTALLEIVEKELKQSNNENQSNTAQRQLGNP